MARVFTHRNAAGAEVVEVETMRKLDQVMSVDVDTGEVELAHKPLRTVGDEIDTYKQRYRSIYPIYGGARRPVLFHCYGRQA